MNEAHDDRITCGNRGPLPDFFERDRGLNRRWPFIAAPMVRAHMAWWAAADRPPNEFFNIAGNSWPWSGGKNERGEP